MYRVTLPNNKEVVVHNIETLQEMAEAGEIRRDTSLAEVATGRTLKAGDHEFIAACISASQKQELEHVPARPWLVTALWALSALSLFLYYTQLQLFSMLLDTVAVGIAIYFQFSKNKAERINGRIKFGLEALGIVIYILAVMWVMTPRRPPEP